MGRICHGASRQERIRGDCEVGLLQVDRDGAKREDFHGQSRMDEQKGRIFTGRVEWMSKKGETDKLNFSGVIAGNNKTLYIAVHDYPGFEIGELGPNDELTLYKIRTGPEAMSLMKKLKKVK